MKRVVFLLFFIMIIYSGYSQVAYLGMGYNVSNGSYKDFNYVIDRYNETRDYLTTEMDQINLTHGMVFEFGYAQPGFLGSVGLQYNRAKVEAVGVINEVSYQRDLKFHGLNIPFELAYVGSSDGFAIAPGVGFNFLLWKYLTRYGKENKVDDYDYEKSSTDIGMHAKFFIKFIFGGVEEPGLGLILEPYYNLGFLDSEMWLMNEELNPNTYYDDPHKVEKFNQYGLRFTIILKTE